MKDDLESIRLVMDVVREKVNLPVARPAGWHDRAWIKNTGSGRIPEHLRDNYVTHPQAIKNLIGNALRKLKGYAIPWRER